MDSRASIPPSSRVEISAPWEHFFASQQKYNDYEFPKVTIVIPTFDCAQSITLTLDSVVTQNYPDFEVLVIDGGSTDATLEAVKSYRDDRVQVYTVSTYQRYEMLNKGLSLASGYYINFIFPGDFYIYKNALYDLMVIALESEMPHLAYCASLIRDRKRDVKILYRPFAADYLRRGRQPTSLQSCWWRVDVFGELGKFDASCRLRGGFDLLCRFLNNGHLKYVSVNRVLTDYELRNVTRRIVLRHFFETFKIIYRNFGGGAALVWVFVQKDYLRLMRLWYRSLRWAFIGRP